MYLLSLNELKFDKKSEDDDWKKSPSLSSPTDAWKVSSSLSSRDRKVEIDKEHELGMKTDDELEFNTDRKELFLNFKCEEEYKNVTFLLINSSTVTERIYRTCVTTKLSGGIVNEWNKGEMEMKTLKIVYEYDTESCCRSKAECFCPRNHTEWYQFPSFEISSSETCEASEMENLEELIGNELVELYGLPKEGCVHRKKVTSSWNVKLNEGTVMLDDNMNVEMNMGESINGVEDTDRGLIQFLGIIKGSHSRVKRESNVVDCDYLNPDYGATTIEPTTTVELTTQTPINCDYHADMTTIPPTTEEATTTMDPTTTPADPTTSVNTEMCEYFSDFMTTTQEATTTASTSELTTERTTMDPTTELTTTIETSTIVTTTESTTTMGTTEQTTTVGTTLLTTTMSTMEPSTTTQSTSPSTSTLTTMTPSESTTSIPSTSSLLSTTVNTFIPSSSSSTTVPSTIGSTTTMTSTPSNGETTTTMSTSTMTTPSTTGPSSSLSSTSTMTSTGSSGMSSTTSSLDTTTRASTSDKMNGMTTTLIGDTSTPLSSSSSVTSSMSSIQSSTMTSSVSSKNDDPTKTTMDNNEGKTTMGSSSSTVTSSNSINGITSSEGVTSSTKMNPSTPVTIPYGTTVPSTGSDGQGEFGEITICDFENSISMTTESILTTGKNCVLSMLNLNISANSNNPSVVYEKNIVVGSNILVGCPYTSYGWTVNGISVDASSPYSLPISLTIGQVSHVCLNMESKSGCGFIKYDLPTTTSVLTTQSTAIVTRTIDHNLEIIGHEIKNLIDNRCNGTNGTNLVEALTKLKDPQSFINTLTKVLQGQLNLSNGGLSTDEVIDQLKKYTEIDNDDVAKAMAILMKQLANVTITDTDTLKSILNTLDAALKGSLSYSLTGEGKTLAGVYGVIFGTIKGPKVNLMSAKCSAQVDGNVFYVKGDIRSAKFQDIERPITITNNVRMMAIENMQAIGFSAEFGMSPFENYTIAGKRQQYKIIGDTQMTVGSGMIEPENGMNLWNCSFNPLGAEKQQLKNMTFTSWVKVSNATLIIEQTASTLTNLKLGQLIPSISLKIFTDFGDMNNMTYLGGKVQLMEMNANFVSFALSGGSFSPSPTLMVTKSIVDPVRIEGISTDMLLNMDSQSGNSKATLNILPAKGYTMMMITGFNDVPPLEISEKATTMVINATFRSVDSSLSKASLESKFTSGEKILFYGGNMVTSSTTMTFSDISLIYDGTKIIVASERNMVIEDAKWKIINDGFTRIVITGGYFVDDGMEHTQTVLELSETSRVVIDGGTIIRNASDGYLILNGQITKIGDIDGGLTISPQSLMNQDAQKEILKILNNTADYLLQNGKNMTDDDLESVAKSLLSIFGKINRDMAETLSNPLYSDLMKNLAYEKANYDDIFNSLPRDSSKIRYVEEYTQEEWAAEATRLVQQQIAREMAAQMERLMGILEDTLVERMTIPGSVSYETDGNSMVVTAGRADQVLKMNHVCTDWTVVFPEKVEYLNTDAIVNETEIRVSLICYKINPYAYVDNANVLVSSGALSASLKTMKTGMVIAVNQTHDPIIITGKGGGKPSGSTLVLSSDYKSYQILDMHTFHTVQWNSSVVIEITPYMIRREEDPLTEVWAFVGFQRLPGPFEGDYDFKIKIDKRYKSSLFISSWDLFNRTGLFYVGIGVRSLSSSFGNDGDFVTYPSTPSDVNGTWVFSRSVSYDYRLRAITKGCYYFLMGIEKWDASGIETGNYVGDVVIKCKTFHMTYFAGGIYTPEVPNDFSYQYVEQSFPKSCLVFLSILFIIVHQSVVTWMANKHTRTDRSKGQLRIMTDNYPLDTYKYIVVVDTGFKMFATTDSEIHVNIVGEEWEALNRTLKGGNERIPLGLKWGTTERFLMTTQYPLGQLKYLSIWIDSVGLQHRESWFCDRVIVYDLQKKEEFLFKVDNWLGTQNGDGKTERTVGSSKKPFFLWEAMWKHRLYENIAYIAMYTGGGSLKRLRVTRPIHSGIVYFGLFIVSLVNILIARGEDFSHLPSFEKNLFGFYFSIRDIIMGIVYSLLLLPFTIVFPLIFTQIKSELEEYRLYRMRRFGREEGYVRAARQFPFMIKAFMYTMMFFFAIILILYSVHFGFSMNEDMQNAFTRRFFIMIAVWILVTEPLKGLIITSIYSIFHREHYYINRYEKSFMRILPRQEYSKAPPFLIDVEKSAKLAESKSERSEDQRMRDEQLFNTARQVITFFASIFILLGLTYFCRDRFGFFYQQEVNSLFSINGNPYDGKSFQGIQTIDHFYNWTLTKLIPGLRVSWYDGKPAWDMRGFMNDKTSRSMGYGIIRQVRSKSGLDCKLADKFKPYFDSCQGYTSRSHEDNTEAYTVGWGEATTKNSNFTRQEYIYRSQEELQGKMIIGNMDSYTGGGYAWDIIGTLSDLTEQMNRLQKEGWIDENTRAIAIEFAMYNAQVNYFAVIQLLLENPPDGALYPSVWIETVRLMKYVGEDGKYVMAFEALYVLFTILNFVAQIYELSTVGFKLYFSTFWHLLGLLVVLCSAFSLYAYGSRYISMEEAATRFMATNGNTYIRLDSQRDLELYFTWLMGFVVFAVSIQMIRILRFNRRIAVLALTLEKSASSMGGFALIYILINAAFDSALYTLLYSKLLNYRNFLAVTEATTASLLGKFSVTDVLAASTLGSIMFLCFMLTGTIVLVNMFVMIVMYEFEAVRNDKDNQTNEYEVVQHISSKLLQTMGMYERSNNPNTDFPNYLEHCSAVDALEKQVNHLDLLIENMREVNDEDVEEAKKGICERKMYFPH
ncbi:lov-1 [Pristionchus pacificus]|uniref:Lov-1 n=1 Tax=Pristionchus pacificus TaxID=54126 RepID=A0A2A6BEE9_PRIPA|nr:lov-1 [Pristionchus pacificus]|eukprot:PDM64248.1 lov-1 [Pristionchus pacificus]